MAALETDGARKDLILTLAMQDASSKEAIVEAGVAESVTEQHRGGRHTEADMCIQQYAVDNFDNLIKVHDGKAEAARAVKGKTYDLTVACKENYEYKDFRWSKYLERISTTRSSCPPPSKSRLVEALLRR